MANSAAPQGQVYVSGWQKRLVTSPLLPRFALLGIAKAAVHLMRRHIRAHDRVEAERVSPHDSQATDLLYFADIYHGGATFWDWIVLRGGGLWWKLVWPLVIDTTIQRLRTYPELRTVLDVDAHTFEELEVAGSRAAIARLREVIADGRMEIADGTYAQPLASTIGSEANLRHFFYGLDVIERVLGARVDSFVAGEPQFFPQLPQVLAGFGIPNAVFRTHWAPFGTDPACNADIVRWRGPDGSEIRTVPRYECMDYELAKPGHPGVHNAGLTGDDFEQWSEERQAQFMAEAARAGIGRPFITRLADPKPPESPFPKLITAAHRPRARLVTVREYFDATRCDAPVVHYTTDDIPSTIPWGLAGEELQREQVRAESTLLVAERLDAIVQCLGSSGHEASLDAAWKLLLRAQHHDLHLCSPWHSMRHGISMGEIGCDFARRATYEADAVTAAAVEALADRFGSGTAARAVLLFNPSPWPRRELVQLAGDGGTAVWQGERQLATQATQWNDEHPAVAFVAELPPLGFDIIELRPAAGALSTADAAATLPVTSDPLTDLSSAVRGAYLTLWEEGRWHRSHREQIEIEANGPVFRRYRVRGRILDLRFTQSIIAVPALQRLQITTDIDFGTGRYVGPQLSDHDAQSAYYIQDDRKLCLNFSARLPQLFCDSPFLLAEPRGPRFTASSFAGLEDRGAAVALLHKGTPGWHIAREDGVLRNVLAWGPRQWLYASDDSLTPGRSRYTAVRGAHRYEHAIAAIGSRLDAIRSAHDFRLPVLVVDLPQHDSSATLPRSLLTVAPEQVILTALFARHGQTYARLWNASHQSVQVELPGAQPVSLRLKDEPASSWPQMRPWGIQTVRLPLAPAS